MRNSPRRGRSLTRILRKLVASAVAAVVLGQAVGAAAQTVEYYHLDALGSVRAITDQNAAVIERHDYLPFGEEWNPQPSIDARKFTGKERDVETGYDYFGARYLSAKTARFTTTDPSYTLTENLVDPQRWNRYAYVRNNPLRYTDPDGKVLSPLDFGFLAVDVYSVASNPRSALNWAALAVDAVLLAVPIAPAVAGELVRAAQGAGRVAEAVRSGDTLIQLNRAAGKAAEARVADELIREGQSILGSQVCCNTPAGRRFIDFLTKDGAGNLTAVEVKSGAATRSSAQVTKDTEIAAGRGTFAGKNAPPEVKGLQRPVKTVERRPGS